MQSVDPTSRRAQSWHYAALGAVMLIAITLHFARLHEEGFANLYYAATVKSMLTNWHNFLYASFDPGGFVSVDKPPLGLWVQALGATLLGFNGYSLLLPQALAGVFSVALLYHLVARIFGATAGVIAALALAVTPISVAANRNNTMDAQLVFVLLLGAWALSIAAERGQLRWLSAGMVLVGLGFNIKMLQAYMVLPAFYAVYFLAARTSWRRRVAHLLIATIPLLLVSFAWVAFVDMTSPVERPYVGSSRNNTVTELVVGHNGVTRLGQIAGWLGLRGGPPRLARLAPESGSPANPAPSNPRAIPPNLQPNPRNPAPLQPSPRGQPPPYFAPSPPPQNPVPNTPPRGIMSENGEPGILRLFNQQLAGQTSWLLPLAFLGFIVAALAARWRFPVAREHSQLVLWLLWLVPMALFFSFAGLIHRYYLEMMAPAIAALVGAGIAAMWTVYTRHRVRGLTLPFALVVGAATQVAILSHFRDWNGWLIIVVPTILVLAAVALVVARLPRLTHLQRPTAVIGILALFIAPTLWAMTPVMGADAGLPFAGPELLSRPPRPQFSPLNPMIDYLVANRYGEKFLAATFNAHTAAPIILATGEPVMSIGGFGGNDQILTVDQFRELVTLKTVRFFLMGGTGNQQQDIARWVVENCRNVSFAVRGAPQPRPGTMPTVGQGAQQLYDCVRE